MSVYDNYQTESEKIPEGHIRIWMERGDYEYMDFDDYLSRIRKYALRLEPKFQFDDQIDAMIRKLALYFFRDERFESEGHGLLNKGILLVGDVGVGKTLMLKLFE